MTNGPRKTVSPRIARMLRELEGPPPGDFAYGFDDDAPASGVLSTRHRAPEGNQHRLIRAGVVAGAAIVTVLTAMQARAPIGDDKQAVAGAKASPQNPADVRRMAQSGHGGEASKAK